MKHTLVVVLDKPSVNDLAAAALLVSRDKVSFLVLNRDLVDWSAQLLGSPWTNVPMQELDALRYLQQAVGVARDKYREFIGLWPGRFCRDGKNFKELFVHEGRLSLWWLTELCLKNNENRPMFDYLVKLEALRLALAETPSDRVVLFCGNADLTDVLCQLCRALGIEATVIRSARRRNPDRLSQLLLRRAKHALLDLAATLMSRAVYLVRGNRLPVPVESVVFHTWYPAEWAKYHGELLDRYYVDVPQALREGHGIPTVYLATIQPRRLKALISHGPRCFDEQTALAGNRVVFVERFISPIRLAAIYADPRNVFRCLALERDRVFRDSFRYDDAVNIFPIARHELRLSFITGVPQLLVLANRVRDFVRSTRPLALVTYIELYNYGRALTYGVHSAGVATKVIGYQHARITRNQLFYNYFPGEVCARPDRPDDMVANMPIPTLFLLHGLHAYRLLLSGGYPSQRLCVTGSARFDDLASLRARSSADRLAERRRFDVRDDQKLVAVATPFWVVDTQRLIAMAFQATADRPDIWLIFKPHPNYRSIENVVRQAAERTGHQRFGITGENLHALAAAADAMLTVNSTSGAEALVANCPVVNVRLTDVDLSPFVEVTDGVPEASNTVELRQALDRVLDQPPGGTVLDEIVEGVFHKLDGQAKQRTVEAILGVIGR